MLQNYQLVNSKVSSFLNSELRNNVSKNQLVINTLEKRFFDLLSLEEIPSPRVISDYLNPDNVDNFSYDMAAKSCEFYGGVGNDFLQNPKLPFNLNDYELLLSSIYYKIGDYERSYAEISDKSSQVLLVFRKSTKFLKNFGLESKIIKLF